MEFKQLEKEKTMITHLGISFKRHDGVLINSFQLIDKPFPYGKSYAEVRFENAELVSQIYADSLSLYECDEFAKKATAQVNAQLNPITSKAFKVIAVSSNHNSIGLRNHVMVAKDGESWSAGKSIASKRPNQQGDIIIVPYTNGHPQWAALGFQIPKRLEPDAPPNVLKEVWKI